METLVNDRILIVDDTPSIHDDIRKILAQAEQQNVALERAMEAVFGAARPADTSRQTFKVDSAFSGQEGLQKAQAACEAGQPYAVAFVDLEMPPGWNGLETIKRIWEFDAEIQIVICTASTVFSWQEIVRQVGPTDRLIILKKPFDDSEVLQAAHAMARKWSLTRQSAQQQAALDQALADRTKERDEIALLHLQLTREVAEREQIEANLRDSEERLSKAFDASPLPTVILRSFDQRCVHVNPAFLDATERREKESLGRTLWDNGIGASDEFCRKAVEDLYRGIRFEAHACQFRTRTGESRHGLLWLEPIQLATGPHVLALLQDVTEQRALEAQLRQAQKMDAVGQLAAGIAHDFNNLLQVIQGHTSLQLMQSSWDPQVTETLQEVQKAAQRASELTRQLLAFSRKQVMARQPLPLAGVLSGAIEMLERVIPANIKLRCAALEGLPPIVADAEQLQQVILNLAINARDAMPAGGTLSVGTSLVEVNAEHTRRVVEARAGQFVRLTIADDGEGMDPQHVAQIFEPFFTTKEVGEGPGLGLASVHGIVKQHEGWVEVESERGRGTTFHVYLPLAQSVSPKPLEPAAKPASPLRGRTILLTDDNADVRNIARYLLEANGCRVLTAANGVEALGIWKEHGAEIELLLTDMVMPGGLSGADLAARLRAERPTLPVIYSSGYSVALFREDLGIREGVNYLPKPYLAQKLLAIVAQALSATERQQAIG